MSSLSFYDEMVGLHDTAMYHYEYDFMPFSDNQDRYFTGQYSSRPNLKTAIREASQTLHAAQKLYLTQIIGRGGKHEESLSYLRSAQALSEAIATAQSADIITGTSRSGISEATVDKLRKAIEENQRQMAGLIEDITYDITGVSSKSQ